MPKRQDLKSILIIGSGPILIGQACEFDYSGAQACTALREEGYRVILINSNPATIMTDPKMADATYIEPIEWRTIEKIIEKEKPDALLPTMGGQTALNCALDLERHGVLEKHGVEMIGAKKEAIDKAEDRDLFREAMLKIGLDMPKAAVAHNIEQAHTVQKTVGFPTIIRPSFTMGGSGGGIAYNKEEFVEICERGLDLSPTNELLIEESILGWKEFEMEVVRDSKDNCIIVCSIENLDPMGIHTGDSITVAPAQTLTDKEYQVMRDASLAVLREIGVDTGGSNVQFALNPKNGRLTIIEMNPRVSRSSALASKATGFPIARVAAKLAIGYTLDELDNEITGGKIPASFEPSIDYVVTKIPRFAFEKFPKADDRLTTQMKSVGEVMAIGSTFQESLQKALRGLETDKVGLDPIIDLNAYDARNKIRSECISARGERIFYLADAFRLGMSVEEVFDLSKVDPWFLTQIQDIVSTELQIDGINVTDIDADKMFTLKRKGFSDARLAQLFCCSESSVRERRRALNIKPVFKRVDSCAAEFDTQTAYLYSTYQLECEANPTNKKKIMILGGGPNRIGQGIEFDCCCVHASLALREDGFETIMVNCNPETVSTDYDISDRLYFEPLTLEDVLTIVDIENPDGIIVHYGGQTPLKLADALEKNGANIIGTTPDAIDLAEDRERFSKMLQELELKQPLNGTARSLEQAQDIADAIGFPLIVRPSYVLGGRAMEIVYDKDSLEHYMYTAVQVSNNSPVLLDSFLDHAIEVDIDAICDGEDVVIGGIMQHIEQAGIHSGDSACSLPPYSLASDVLDEMRIQVIAMAKKLNVIGLMNTQLAYQDGEIYIIEVNPRASRTVPFVSKAIGVPLARIAARVMSGVSLKAQNFTKEIIPKHFSVKEAVFPFNKFLGVDPVLGPEMRSTGEVMGIGKDFASAFDKAQLAAGSRVPENGKVFVSLRKLDRNELIDLGKKLLAQGFSLVSTRSNRDMLNEAGLECEVVNKVSEGSPHIVDMIKNDDIDLIINSTEDTQGVEDAAAIRCQVLVHKVPFTTTVAAAFAILDGLKVNNKLTITKLQSLHL
ncbi:carbamoyl-phosphate synthase large subunit [Candidatus Ruthia magnifica str. Cm (Calyptogena magnifica)]|uniref:Carbamoyl phosphate synthase large chain n=1 Tax=Ruthia magnifica subsp. Calyptogena magnifica TaxID=413404 RepID=A1AXD3_RUTMC|nr:carbamoyl-phosphate synthase large subunit [Candidatus Ruthturnera calyptogenae]ABL02590.1 carbamoyl-phosphate synthase large subunit [Candidatus Ruthia magnifica str. Cm (Calyptogena magnifica)]